MWQHNIWCLCVPPVWRGMLASIPLHTRRTHTHQMLCCHITTLIFTFSTDFKISDFNEEYTSSLKMISIMIETCWSVFECFNINILN